MKLGIQFVENVCTLHFTIFLFDVFDLTQLS